MIGISDSLYLRVLRPGDALQLAELEQQLFTAEAWSLALVEEELHSPCSHYFGVFQNHSMTDRADKLATGESAGVVASGAEELAASDSDSLTPGQSDSSSITQPDRLVAYAGYKGELEADLTVVAVQPEFRRQGLGRSLVEVALRDAHDRGVAVMFLEVRASNLPAQRLYASLRFEVVNRIRGYYQNPLEDALLMSLSLKLSDKGQSQM